MDELHSHPYTIHYEDRGPYLRALVSGETDTVATSLGYWNEIAAECRRRGKSLLLVVENFGTSSPLGDVFQVAEKLPAIVRGLRVAFVDQRLEDYSENEFGELVAVNRGVIGKLFAEEADAVRWLENEAGPPG
jgi:hypothetical protein